MVGLTLFPLTELTPHPGVERAGHCGPLGSPRRYGAGLAVARHVRAGGVLARQVVIPPRALSKELVNRSLKTVESLRRGGGWFYLSTARYISGVLARVGACRYCARLHLRVEFENCLRGKSLSVCMYLGFLRAGGSLHLAAAVHCLPEGWVR